MRKFVFHIGMSNPFHYRGRIARCGRLLMIILSLIITTAQAQTIKLNPDGSADIHFKTQEGLNKYIELLLNQSEDLSLKDSLIMQVYKPAIETCKKSNIDCDSVLKYRTKQIEALREQVTVLMNNLPAETDGEGFMEFKGVYAGVKTGYLFSDTVFTKSQFMGSLWDNVSGFMKTGVRIGKCELNVYLELPLARRRSTGVYFEGGWRVF